MEGHSHIVRFHNQGTEDPSETREEFDIFYEELRKEAKTQGLGEEPSEEDARELFEALQEAFSTGSDDDDWSEDVDEDSRSVTAKEHGSPDTVAELSEDDKSTHLDSETKNSPLTLHDNNQDDTKISAAAHKEILELSALAPEQVAKIQELQTVLPGFPISRLKKVLKTFESTLGYPSILTLVPILRETLPDQLGSGRLKKLNMSNADFILQKAEEFGTIDVSVLNSMLQVKTSAGYLDEAEAFHREEFRRHNLVRPLYFQLE
jgi:hypothetical protein